MKQKAWKTFLDNEKFIMSIRVAKSEELCHRVLEMDPIEFFHESFFTFIELYSIGADIRKSLPKRLVRELNSLHWDYMDEIQTLPGLPSEISNAEVIDEDCDY